MKTLALFIACCFSFEAATQQLAAFRIYTDTGKSVSFEKMMRELQQADVVFFGEMHNNPVNHWLELKVLQALYAADSNLVLAMEMFEADDQLVIDEYLSGIIEERHLLKEAKVWDNYKTDYKPLVAFAKEKKLKLVASNIPRRYANLVYRKGADALGQLPAEAKACIAPLPFETDLTLPGYQEIINSMGGHGNTGSPENLALSQSSKDATMAWFISENLSGRVLHINGAYHSKNREGIVWYLKKYRPGAKVATIHCVEQDNPGSLDEKNKDTADFIIAVPSDMTKTY